MINNFPFHKLKSIFLLCVFLLINSILGFGQSFPSDPSQIKEIPPSPTMAEFQKYGNYPVSKYTGIPNISLPFYTISLKEVEIPITLNYHSSGIKVDQQASWVGLGWSLSSGGAIIRTVRGSADEASNGYIDYPYYNQGEYDPASDYYKTEEMMQGIIDTEPDVFSYNFMGYSGRFTFNPSDIRTNASISLIPHNDLKITPVFSDKIITGFTVITPTGVTAEFGEYETSEEYRGESNLGATYIRASSTWHLKKITTPTNQSITFEYILVPGLNSSSPGMVNDPSFIQTSSIKYHDPCNTNQYNYEGNSSNSGINFYSVKRISKINFPHGYVSFQSSSDNRTDDPDNESLRLDAIEIYSSINGVNELLKKFTLQYGYFGTVNYSAPDPEYQVRLKLNSIIEEGQTGTSKNPYLFDYKEGGAQNNLPPRYSNSQDYWGYYNGKSNASLIPKHQVTTNSGATIYLGDANREVDPNFSQAGILEKITYPTKGYTEFTFETNRASILENGVLTQFDVGGLRINNIASYDSDSLLEWQKAYEYNNPDDPMQSSGVYNGNSYVTPKDYFGAWTYYFSALSAGSCPSSSTYMGYSTRTEGVSSAIKRTNNFAIVFYRDVKEINGSSSNFTGYTWYHYDVTKDYFMQGLGPGMAFKIDRSWDRGQLLSEEIFENGNATPIISKSYEYENISVQSALSGYKAGARFNVQSLGYVPPEQQSYPYNFRYQQYFLTYYNEPIIWKRLKSSTIVKDGVTTQTQYYYKPGEVVHTNTQRIISSNSKGETQETKFYYPDDIVSENSLVEGGNLIPYELDQIDRLKKDDLHRPSSVIQKVESVNGNVVQIDRTLYDTFTNLQLPSKFFNNKGGNTVTLRTEINDYDTSGNPLELFNTDGPHIIYLWGYNDQYPIAKIENATYSEVSSVLGPLSDVNETHLSAINNLRSNAVLSRAMITTYEYEPLVGITKITDPKGLEITYEYDEFGRLEFVKDDQNNLLNEYKYNYQASAN